MYKITVLDKSLLDSDSEILKNSLFFGHDPKLKFILPDECELPAHLVLTLNTIECGMGKIFNEVGPIVRLVHPFHYSQGQSFAYHHRGSDVVSFVQFDGEADASWPYEGYPHTLPTRKVRIDKLLHRPQLKYDDPTSIYLGKDVQTIQNYGEAKCIACKEGVPSLIASIPNQPIHRLLLWGQDCVNTLFWFCSTCNVFITHNECD